MLRDGVMKAAFWLSFAAAMGAPVLAQSAGVLNPPSSAGSNPLMTGVFVTPVPNAPFSATVVLESTRRLQDGSTESFKTVKVPADYKVVDETLEN